MSKIINLFHSMTFTSLGFYPFLFIVLLLLWVSRRENWRQYILLLSSALFYLSWDLKCFLLLTVETLVCFSLVKKLRGSGKDSKKYLAAGVAFLLFILGLFKYYNFFIEPLLALLGINGHGFIRAILPIGISFYTFSAIGLLLDVYWKNIAGPLSLREVALYIFYFPKLLQGPLHSAQDFLTQLRQEHPVASANLQTGIQIFLFGLFKKVVIADRLGLFVDTVYSLPAAYDAATLFWAVLSYPVQLYCDFSGYSDMAIGISKMIGYDLCQNFNLPFLSRDVSEYWRRWHMSLNLWFRSYLFYPVIRSPFVEKLRKWLKKKGFSRIYRIVPSMIGMAVVWPLIGLWHGPSINYVLHGCCYGTLMCASLVAQEYLGKRRENRFLNGLRILRTMIITVLLLTLFRAANVKEAAMIIVRIISGAEGIHYIYIWALIYLPLVLAVNIFAYCKNHGNGYYVILDLARFKNKVIFCIALLMTLILMYVGENYFMYFQF